MPPETSHKARKGYHAILFVAGELGRRPLKNWMFPAASDADAIARAKVWARAENPSLYGDVELRLTCDRAVICSLSVTEAMSGEEASHPLTA